MGEKMFYLPQSVSDFFRHVVRSSVRLPMCQTLDRGKNLVVLIYRIIYAETRQKLFILNLNKIYYFTTTY